MEKIRKVLEELVEKAIEARFSFELPEFGAEPVELHRSLVQAQEVLTQLEKYLSQAIRSKFAFDRKLAHVKMVWQEAYDRALTSKKIGFGSEFVSGKEKQADANLASFNEARVLRDIEADASFANEAVDIIRLHYYGMDKVRQDVKRRFDEVS